ncbi:MAG: VWA domain-containing protein, partial [Phycisphaerales bacterium]
MNLRFDQPELLLLSLLGIPLAVLGWRWLSGLDPMRRSVVTLLRVGLLTALAVMLAGPRTVQEHHDLTVIGLLDLSGSVRRFADLPEISDLDRHSNVEYLRQWFRLATDTKTKTADDRFGLIVFDGKATVISVPTKGEYIDDDLDVRIMEGTNLAESITLALAMFPAQTAKRLVLVSDGNETIGDALQAARQAAAGSLVRQDTPQLSRVSIPIDVAPIEYEVTGDVQVVRIETPPIAQPGQTITVRILLSSTAATPGRLTLRREGEPIDLNGAEAGVAR